jgi:hypothetical protein
VVSDVPGTFDGDQRRTPPRNCNPVDIWSSSSRSSGSPA